MAGLVRIPWQPSIWVIPPMLALLQRASALAGHHILLNGADSGWRSYVRQLFFWRQYLNGGTKASNPDSDAWNRGHMRGGSADILNRADRQWMIAAGGVPDSTEWWHFDVSNIRSYPLILTFVAAAGGDIIVIPPTPASTRQDYKMFLRRQVPNGEIWLYSDFGRIRLQQESHVNLIQRMVFLYPNGTTSPTTWDNMLQAELELIDYYVRSCQNTFLADMQTRFNNLATDLANRTVLEANRVIAAFPKADVAPIVAAVEAALAHLQVAVDYGKVGDAVAAKLAANFATISDGIARVGTIDKGDVARAVVAEIDKQGVTLGVNEHAEIAAAVFSAVQDKLVQLTVDEFAHRLGRVN